MAINLDPQSKAHLEELILEINRDRCCVFVGSGLSRPAGYPLWQELMTMLCDEVKKKTGQPFSNQSKDYRFLAEDCRIILSADEYRAVLISAFRPDEKERYRSIHQIIRQIPFRGYITTNYDLCVENAGRVLGQNIRTLYFPELDISVLLQKHVYHIHGVLDPDHIDETIGTIILTDRDYLFAYEQNDIVPGFLKQLFPFYTIVFMGYSLGDEDITKVIHTVQLGLEVRREYEIQGGIGVRQPFRNFIFIHREEDMDQTEIDRQEAIIRDLSLLPIYYRGEAKRHSELERIFEHIQERTTNLPVGKVDLYRDVFEG